METQELIYLYLTRMPKNFFIVFGNKIALDFSNIKTIQTMVIPNIGEKILFNNKYYKVTDKIINYKMVENHELFSPDRGGELIYCFVKES